MLLRRMSIADMIMILKQKVENANKELEIAIDNNVNRIIELKAKNDDAGKEIRINTNISNAIAGLM